ncbi:hypothetical protein C8R44DRAFT_864666 [Mycena epipterygia]|nr:hypothetical protein C8R44DRAFT_864666 [Mycena epipterygia]
MSGNAGTITPVSLLTVNSMLLRLAQFACVVYCASMTITSWSCGAPCDALTGVTFLQSGGDEGATPLYLFNAQSIVAAHEGMDASNILLILNDAEFGLVPLNMSGFPETMGRIKLHDGLLTGVMAELVGVTFATNQHNPIPAVPLCFLGFQHSNGESHIVDDSLTTLVACLGQDNTECSKGNLVLAASIPNHLGPYFHDISFSSSECSP